MSKRYRNPIGKAARLFHPRSEWRARAQFLMRHIGGELGEYIQQAPIIVACIHERGMSRQRVLVQRQAKLRDLLADAACNTGLRNASPEALKCLTIEQMRSVVWRLKHANVSALAQQIARRSVHEQEWYWDTLLSLSRVTLDETFCWFAEHLPMSQLAGPDHYVDFIRARRQRHVNDEELRRWKWRDLLAAMKRWEDSFALDKTVCSPESLRPLSPHTKIVQRAEPALGWQAVHLNTVAELDDEGRRMRHCVGGYANAVRRGECVIYSFRSEGKSYATLELRAGEVIERSISSPLVSSKYDELIGSEIREEKYCIEHIQTWHIGQIKGPCNNTVSPFLLDTARRFATQNFEIMEHLAKPIFMRYRFGMDVVRADRRQVIWGDTA